MIKLFRQLRQKLLKNGENGKYFRYAIGEIALVMIGILLALQVNNWNENRKIDIQQKLLLIQLLEDARADSLFLESRLVALEKIDSVLLYINDVDQNDSKTQTITLITNGSGLILPYTYLNLSSNIVSDYTETYGKLSSPGIKKLMRAYNLKYVYLFRILNSLNGQIENNIEPMRYKYYRELRENKKTKSLEILNKIYKDDRILSVVDKMKISVSLTRNRVDELLEINNYLIQMIQSNLAENQ